MLKDVMTMLEFSVLLQGLTLAVLAVTLVVQVLHLKRR